MSNIREELSSMFSKIMAGTVTREEGGMLISHLVRKDQVGTIAALTSLMEHPPPGVFPKTILHTLAITRHRAFYSILVACLDHKNEDISILSANELARLRTDESLGVLVEHLDNEAYHVRKASATAIAASFGQKGVDILKEHVLSHPEPFFRSTSTAALLTAGRPGVEALLSILGSGVTGPVCSAAESLGKQGAPLAGEDLAVVIGALMAAGDRKDTQATVELLRLVGSMGEMAGGYAEYVRAFADHSFDGVRREAQAALRSISL